MASRISDYLAANPVLALQLPGLQPEFGTQVDIMYVAGPGGLLAQACCLASAPSGTYELGGAAEHVGSCDEVSAPCSAALGPLLTADAGGEQLPRVVSHTQGGRR